MLSGISIGIIVYAYVSVAVFVIGTIYVLLKWIFKKKGPTDSYLGLPYLFTYPGQDTRWKAFVNILKRIFLFKSMKRDPLLRYSSLAFHYSVWIIIAAHADIVLEPYLSSYGVSEVLLEDIGAYVGTAFAIILIIFGLVLLYRRIGDRYMRRLTSAGDYFSILLIIAIGITGTIMRFTLSADFAYGHVTPFVSSLLAFAPINAPLQWPFVLHFLVTLTLLLYFPFSKFMHPYSFFTNPTLYSLYHSGDVK